MSPDPYTGSAKGQDPGSWNRYAYVGGDPINRHDSSGLDYCLDGDPAEYCVPDQYCAVPDPLDFAGGEDICSPANYVPPAPGLYPGSGGDGGQSGNGGGELTPDEASYIAANTAQIRIMNLQFSTQCLTLLQGIQGENQHHLVLSDLVIAAKNAQFEVDPNIQMRAPRGTIMNASTFQHTISLRVGLESTSTFNATILHEIIHTIGWDDGANANFDDRAIKQSLQNMGYITQQDVNNRGTKIITTVLNSVCFN